MAKNKTSGGGGGGKVEGSSKISFKAKPKKKTAGPPSEPPPAPRLRAHYEAVARPALIEKFQHKGPMSVPRLTKIVVSMGIGDANENPRKLEALVDDLETITGQRPAVTKARVSIANFKLREGMAVGCRVTLRGARMWEFFDRLVTAVIPRLRDFRGLSSKSFDGRGNYAMGLPDQICFPEVKADRVEFYNGMNLVMCTTARSDEEARELLRLLGLPFVNLPVQVLGGAKE